MKTFKELVENSLLGEASNKQAQKAYDDAMGSEVGGELGVAHNDGDERKARQILQNRGLKGKALNAVVDMMFGESIDEGRVVGETEDHGQAARTVSQHAYHNKKVKSKNKTDFYHNKKHVGVHDHTSGRVTVL